MEATAILDLEAPRSGERVLLLAPPGELGAIAESVLAAVGEGGRVIALVRGDPWLQGAFPARLEIHDADPGHPHQARGPFDLVLCWGSTPFARSFEQLLGPLRQALRPGGRLAVELPSYGFCPALQASDPRASEWWLPGVAAWREALSRHDLRAVEANSTTRVSQYETLAELVDALVRPFAVDFEGQRGLELTEVLRENLAKAFEGAEEIAVARRFVRARALR